MMILSIYTGSLQKNESDEPISSDMQGITIFSSISHVNSDYIFGILTKN
jgi:hypothetical protein